MDSRDSASAGARASSGRWVAGLVLVPAVPLLLASVLALAAFYASPERFGAWLSRLPGDTYLRTAMIFAPACLLAVVVLATLYLRDSAAQEVDSMRIGSGVGRAARLSMAITGPLLGLIGAIYAARYLDADRVESWLEALPATGYLHRGLDMAPLVLLLALGVGILLGYAPAGRPIQAKAPPTARRWTRARVGRVAAAIVLALAAPALGLSLLGLVFQATAPGRFARLLEPLPGDTYLRLLLMLAPTGLLAVLLLALLYLLGPLDPERTQPVRVQALEERPEPPRRGPEAMPAPAVPSAALPLALSPTLRSDLAMIVLVVGMVLAVAAGALLVGGMLVLLLVR